MESLHLNSSTSEMADTFVVDVSEICGDFQLQVVGASTKSDDDNSAVEIVVQRIRESFEDCDCLLI